MMRLVPKTYFSNHFLMFEDGRNERLVKQRYPSVMEVILQGLQYPSQKDFFGIGDRDVNTLYSH